jgi:hypothetical protein
MKHDVREVLALKGVLNIWPLKFEMVQDMNCHKGERVVVLENLE